MKPIDYTSFVTLLSGTFDGVGYCSDPVFYLLNRFLNIVVGIVASSGFLLGFTLCFWCVEGLRCGCLLLSVVELLTFTDCRGWGLREQLRHSGGLGSNGC